MFKKTETDVLYVEYNACNVVCGHGVATTRDATVKIVGNSGGRALEGDLIWVGDELSGVVRAELKRIPVTLTRVD